MHGLLLVKGDNLVSVIKEKSGFKVVFREPASHAPLEDLLQGL